MVQNPCRIIVALLLADFIFGGEEFLYVGVVAVIVFVSPKRAPGGDELGIIRACHSVWDGGLQRVAGERIKFIVALALRDDARRMRMVVDGSNFADFRPKRRIGGLRAR